MSCEGGSCEKYLRLVGRKFQEREITERTIREFNLGSEGWKGETEVVRGASFPNGFDVDEITQICWVKFMEEVVSY